jgi:aryl sulfotransferase
VRVVAWKPQREYRSIIFDNLRWTDFEHRADDIFVCTPAKNGTTWMQTIVTTLLFPDGAPGPVMHVAPWLDARFEPIEVVLQRLDAQTHRRQIKTHTPADGIPHFDDASYIVVGRDGRDCFMSFLNHMRNLQPALVGDLLTSAIDEAIPMDVPPPPVDDEHEFFAWYLDHGMQLSHLASWWRYHDDPNVLFVHYDDMKADLDGEMRRVSAFLDITVDEARWADQVAACTFEGMKARADEIAAFEDHFVGGADTFLYKGTNGRWREVLTTAELAAYDAAVARSMPPECAAWMAGRTAVTPAR